MEFMVDSERCVRCGACIQECPTGLLIMGDEGPKKGRGGCILCGHCVAVCPTEAIDYDGTPRAQQVDLRDYKTLSAEEAELFLRSRRSVRQFSKKQVSKEEITRLLNVARMAPTSTNTQGVSYMVIQNPETIAKIRQHVTTWMESMSKLYAQMRIYYRTITLYEKTHNRDPLFHEAPTLVFALAPKRNFERGLESSHFCLSYAELFAPSLGLGTCWSGFAEYCGKVDYEPLVELLQIPDDKRIGGAIVVGYPTHTFRRAPERRPLEVTFDK